MSCYINSFPPMLFVKLVSYLIVFILSTYLKYKSPHNPLIPSLSFVHCAQLIPSCKYTYTRRRSSKKSRKERIFGLAIVCFSRRSESALPTWQRSHEQTLTASIPDLTMNQAKNIDQSKVQGSNKSLMASSPNQERARACRRIVSLFQSDVIPASVYGSNYFLAASVIFETGKHECGTTRQDRSTRKIRK